jgi:hypothetical protein
MRVTFDQNLDRFAQYGVGVFGCIGAERGSISGVARSISGVARSISGVARSISGISVISGISGIVGSISGIIGIISGVCGGVVGVLSRSSRGFQVFGRFARHCVVPEPGRAERGRQDLTDHAK